MRELQSVTANDFDAVVSSPGVVLVDFWAAWCGPCLALSPVLQEVQETLDGAVRIVKVNSDENSSVASKLGVRGLPTLVLYKNGQPVDQKIGVQSKGQLLSWLKSHI